MRARCASEISSRMRVTQANARPMRRAFERSFVRQLADCDRDEDEVVDAEHDLERRQRQQRDPGFGRKKIQATSAIPQRGRQALQNISVQHSITLNISNNTAAEPMSLARPASSWNSGLALSVIASIAELSNSADSTSSRLPHRIAFSIAAVAEPQAERKQDHATDRLRGGTMPRAARRRASPPSTI